MLLTLSYKDYIRNIHKVNEIMDHNIVIGKTFLLTHGKDEQVIHYQVTAWADQFDQEKEMFLVSLGAGQATDTMAYDAITNVWK